MEFAGIVVLCKPTAVGGSVGDVICPVFVRGHDGAVDIYIYIISIFQVDCLLVLDWQGYKYSYQLLTT